MHKRRFLQWAVCTGAAGAAPAMVAAQSRQTGDFALPAVSFASGVASGSPEPDGVVLWTRISAAHSVTAASHLPKPLPPQLPPQLPVAWQVWPEGQSDQVVAHGTVMAQAQWGHSVHAEVTGLRPDQWYQYRFQAGDAQSPVGRTRTLPLATAMPSGLRLAYASCQRWEDGHYAAYRHMRADQPDMVVFLGDYIYEYASRKPDKAVRTHSLRHARSLSDYRDRYALYRSDPDLQAMHAACPWLLTWDDHEVENNYAGLLSTAGTTDLGTQRRAAYQAFYEFMPIRRAAWQQGLQSLLGNEPLRIHLRLDFGRLARVHLLDNRQYRDAPPCGTKPNDKLAAVCVADEPPLHSMLGLAQESWLQEGLTEAAQRGQQWNLLAQQTCFTPRNYRSGPGVRQSLDSWDAFPQARQRLLDALVASRAQNPVFLGGDIHQNWVAEVHQNPYKTSTPVVAAEFCGTSITSRVGINTNAARTKARNPHCLLANSDYRGYGLVDISPTQMKVALRVIEDVRQAEAGVSTLATFSVHAGSSKIYRV